MFTKAEFLLSAASSSQFPDLRGEDNEQVAEIAVVGRSNVGKSSLINHLTRNKGLARTSSTPGKTQLINFFMIDEKLCLVDLPGYGFANVPKAKREAWGRLVQEYLQNRQSLGLILLLCDLRHAPSKDDIAFIQWAVHFNKPLLVVFTKADKLNPGSIQHQMKKNSTLLLEGLESKNIPHISYSIKDAKTRDLLIRKIEETQENRIQWA